MGWEFCMDLDGSFASYEWIGKFILYVSEVGLGGKRDVNFEGTLEILVNKCKGWLGLI